MGRFFRPHGSATFMHVIYNHGGLYTVCVYEYDILCIYQDISSNVSSVPQIGIQFQELKFYHSNHSKPLKDWFVGPRVGFWRFLGATYVALLGYPTITPQESMGSRLGRKRGGIVSHGVKIRCIFPIEDGGMDVFGAASHLLVDPRVVFVATQIMASCRDFGEDFRLQRFQPKIRNPQVWPFFWNFWEQEEPKRSTSCRWW